MVVEDHNFQRKALMHQIRGLGYGNLLEAQDGEEALTQCQHHQVDILFCDLRMPGMDGLQAARLIRGDESLRQQPAIVLVTAFGREEIRDEAEHLQLDGYLLDTWQPRTRPASITMEPRLRWLGLQVLAHARQGDDHATVSFVARSRLAGRPQRHAELSRFVREGGRWFYLDGDVAPG